MQAFLCLGAHIHEHAGLTRLPPCPSQFLLHAAERAGPTRLQERAKLVGELVAVPVDDGGARQQEAELTSHLVGLEQELQYKMAEAQACTRLHDLLNHWLLIALPVSSPDCPCTQPEACCHCRELTEDAGGAGQRFKGQGRSLGLQLQHALCRPLIVQYCLKAIDVGGKPCRLSVTNRATRLAAPQPTSVPLSNHPPPRSFPSSPKSSSYGTPATARSGSIGDPKKLWCKPAYGMLVALHVFAHRILDAVPCGAQAARKKASEARQDLQALQTSAQALAEGGPTPEVARLQKAVAARQQKVDGLQARINDIEARVFAPLSAKVRCIPF